MFKKSFKIIGFVMLSLMIALAGCSKETSNGGESSDGEKEQELRVINWRVEDKEIYDKLHAKFTEKYPNIKLKYDAVPTKDYSVLYKSRIAANEVDVVAGDPVIYLKTQNDREMIMDLKGQEFLDRYQEDVLKTGEVDGKQLLVPWNSVAFVTFYNKKLLEDLGIEVPKTWDEFVAASEKVREAGHEPIVFGGKDQWPIAMVVQQLEGSIVRSKMPDFHEKIISGDIEYTDPTWVELFEKLQTVGSYFQKNSAGLAYGNAPGIFAQGKAAFMIDGNWSASAIQQANPDFEYGVFNLPGTNDVEANKNVSVKIGGGWMVLKDTPNKDAAMKYLDFMSDPENYKEYADATKSVPVIKDVEIEDPAVKQVSELLVANNQIPIWEYKMVPGGKYEFVKYGMELVMQNMKPEKAAEKLQQDLMKSKDFWKE